MAKSSKKFEGVKCMTPTFRASFLNVFEPRAYEDGPLKYSVEMLFSKDKTDLTEMKKKMLTAVEGAWGKDKAKWPKNFRWPFKDGDTLEDASEHHKGCIIAKADSQQAPGIFDQKKNDIINKHEFVSGDYARASLFMVPYENIGGKFPEGKSGLKLYLQGIQLVAKGEPFAKTSKDDFDEVEGEEEESETEDMGF